MRKFNNGRFPSKDNEHGNIHLETSNVPVPPKRNYKNRLNAALLASQNNSQDEGDSTANSPVHVAVGAGLNVPRRLGNQTNNNIDRKAKHSAPPPKVYNDYEEPNSEIRDYLLSQEPDVIIGDGVEIKGNFQFDGLLRLDGRFQGTFDTVDGNLIVGPTGVLISDLKRVHRLLIEGGHVHGNIEVTSVTVSGAALVKGSIVCQQLEIIDSTATILADTTVSPHAIEERVDEPPSDDPPVEPVKVISYNKSRSTKSLHEKSSPDIFDVAPVETAEELLRAKNEEKKKRREEKQKEESKKVSENQSGESARDLEDSNLKKNATSTVPEEKVEELRQKHSAKVIQNAWKHKENSTTTIEEPKVDSTALTGKEASKEDPEVKVEEFRQKHSAKVIQNAWKHKENSTIIPTSNEEPKSEPNTENSEERVEELRQKHSAKVIQHAWKSKGTGGSKAEIELEDSLELKKPPIAVSSKKEGEESLLPAQEVHLVSGALGTIPQVVIQPSSTSSETENKEESKESIVPNTNSSEQKEGNEGEENEISKYGLSQENKKSDDNPPEVNKEPEATE